MMDGKSFFKNELDIPKHSKMTSTCNLTYLDNDFDSESKIKLDRQESKHPGFKEIIHKISKSFGSFNMSSRTTDIDYHSDLKDVNGVDVNVHVIIHGKKEECLSDEEDKMIVERIKNYARLCKASENYSTHELINYYMTKRDELKRTYLGKYAKIKKDNTIDITEDIPSTDESDIFFRIGYEFSLTSNSLVLYGFSKQREFLLTFHRLDMEINIGDAKISIIDAILDTGCTHTVIHTMYLDRLYADKFTEYKERLMHVKNYDAQGNDMGAMEGPVSNLKIEGVGFGSQSVLFARLGNISCLIGMDIINRGYLSLDNRKILFTKR